MANENSLNIHKAAETRGFRYGDGGVFNFHGASEDKTHRLGPRRRRTDARQGRALAIGRNETRKRKLPIISYKSKKKERKSRKNSGAGAALITRLARMRSGERKQRETLNSGRGGEGEEERSFNPLRAPKFQA